MKKTITITALCAGLMFVPTAAYATGDHGGGHTPVTICHKGHEITVDDDAVPAHLAHGDNVGECVPVSDPTPTEEPCPTETATPEPTETPTETPTPTEEPSQQVTPPSETPSETPVAPVLPPVESSPAQIESQISTVTSPPTSAPGLAETGFNPVGWIIASVLVLTGYLMFITASKRRRNDDL